jgi:hypothetical protein
MEIIEFTIKTWKRKTRGVSTLNLVIEKNGSNHPLLEFKVNLIIVLQTIQDLQFTMIVSNHAYSMYEFIIIHYTLYIISVHLYIKKINRMYNFFL